MNEMMSLGECNGIDCIKPAYFTCGRCKAVHYCSDVCNKATWHEHKKVCKRVGEEIPRYRWDPPSTETRKLWTVSEMQKEPNQPMDPPEEYDYIQMWWEDREFLLHGKVVVKSSIFPPQFKKIIQEGLKEKRVTWDYLMSDNFMYQCVNSTLPVETFCIYLQLYMIHPEVKPRMSGLLEIATEHFWRTNALEGWPEYNVDAARAVRRHNIILPFKHEGHNVDEFRLFTHPQDCPCYNCQIRPYLEEKQGERWEALRLAEAKRGRYMVSWASVKEFEQRKLDAYLWDIDTSEPGKYKKWRYEPDEGKNIQHLTKSEVAEICCMLDVAAKCKRPPTHEELDWIMKTACESRVPGAAPTAPTTGAVSTPASRCVGQRSCDKTSLTERDNVSNSKLPSSDVEASPAGEAGVANVSDTDSQATVLPDGYGQESVSKRARLNPATAEDASAVAASVGVVDSVISGVNKIEIVDADPNYSLAAHRPRRAMAMKMVSYVESSSDEEDSQATRLEDPTASVGASAGTVQGRWKHFEVVEDEEECSDWDDSDATRLKSSEDDDEYVDDDATVLEQSSTDSDLTVCDVAEVKRRQAVAGVSAKTTAAKKTAVKHKSAGIGGTGRWTPEQDDKLREAVDLYVKDWVKVAGHVNCGYDNEQCLKRWTRHLDPALALLKKGEWSEAEMDQLKLLVEQHKTDGHKGGINWGLISKELNRSCVDCQSKWHNRCKSIATSTMKKGPFSPEEDVLIAKRVSEWSNSGSGIGLWAALQKEMGRGADIIRKRWRNTLSKK